MFSSFHQFFASNLKEQVKVVHDAVAATLNTKVEDFVADSFHRSLFIFESMEFQIAVIFDKGSAPVVRITSMKDTQPNKLASMEVPSGVSISEALKAMAEKVLSEESKTEVERLYVPSTWKRSKDSYKAVIK